MKVHSQLQKLANKLKTVKPLIKSAFPTPSWPATGPSGSQPYEQGGEYGQEKVKVVNNLIGGGGGGNSTSIPSPSQNAFYILNGTRHEVPYIKNMPNANDTNMNYRPILLENGIVLLVSKQSDGRYKVFTYNDMGDHMPDVNSDEMKVLSKLGTAVYSGISSRNAPVVDILTGESIPLAQIPQNHIPVVIPNSHTGGLLDRGTTGINSDTLYAALEDMGAINLMADHMYLNGDIQVDPSVNTGDGWLWGQDATIGTLRASNDGNNPRAVHPMSRTIGYLFYLASPNYDTNQLTDSEQQHIDTLQTQEAKDNARAAFIQQHEADREAAKSRLQQLGYNSELGYIPGLTNNIGYLPLGLYDLNTDEYTQFQTTKGTSTLYDTPNMIGMFAKATDARNMIGSREGVSMQYTDPYVQGVNKALFNDEAAQQAFQQLNTTYPNFENRKYNPGNLQGDAKILYDLIFRNRQLIDLTAREYAKTNRDFMTPDGNYPEGFDWRSIPVLSSYEGFRSANLSEVNENTNESQDPFTRFAIASLAHKRFRPSNSILMDDKRYQHMPYNVYEFNMASPYGMVTDGRPDVGLYDAATHRANHFWHDIRQDYIQYARQAELMRQAMEYAVPLQNPNTTFSTHGNDQNNNTHLAAKTFQRLYPNENVQHLRMDARDNFMSHPTIQKSYNRLYNGILGIPARAFNSMANGMTQAGRYVQAGDVPVISPVIGGALEYGAYVPGIASAVVDIPGHIMSAGDLIADGVAEHWLNARDQSNIPIMQDYFPGYQDESLDGINPRALELAYRNAAVAAERNMGENPDAQGGAEYASSILGALAIGSLGARGMFTGIGNVSRLLGKTRMSNLVNNAIHNNVDDLVLKSNGVIRYGDDALATARREGTLNNLTLNDAAILRAADIGQQPKYVQALTRGRYPWIAKPIDWTLSFSGFPRMNFTREGLKNWGDLYQHMAVTGQRIPFRCSHVFNPVDPFWDAYMYQRVGYHDENGDFVTITQPSGLDPTLGLSRNTTGLNDIEGVFNQMNNGQIFTDGLYNTVGQGYDPGGSLVYKPYGDVNGTMFTPKYTMENSPWLSYTTSNLFEVPQYVLPILSDQNTSDYIPPSYRPDQDSLDTQIYDYNYPNYIPDQAPVQDYDYPVYDYGPYIYDSGTIYNYNPSQTSTPGYVLPSQIPGQIPTYDNNSPIWGYGAPTSDQSYDTQNSRLELINQNGRMELRYSGNSENTTDSGSNLPSGTSSGTSSGQSGQYKPDTDTQDYSRFDYN